MYREVNFFENNGGGLSAVVKENDKVVKVLTGFEYGNFNTGGILLTTLPMVFQTLTSLTPMIGMA